jgi:hypothetical protein
MSSFENDSAAVEHDSAADAAAVPDVSACIIVYYTLWLMVSLATFVVGDESAWCYVAATANVVAR